MSDLDKYLSRCGKTGKFVLNWAVVESLRRGDYYITDEHILLALSDVQRDLFEKAMRDLGVNPSDVRVALEKNQGHKQHFITQDIKLAPTARKLFDTAQGIAAKGGRDKVEAFDLFAAIFTCDGGEPMEFLRTFGIEADFVANKISAAPEPTYIYAETPAKNVALPPTLKNFGINLNEMARLNKIPPIVGRDLEIEQVAEILCHRDRPNSVMIVGETGVGKTAVVEGLARKLEFQPEALPPRLRRAQIVSVQMSHIVSGTMLRGMFEERMQAIIKELKSREDLILFVDEAHTVIGAGAALGAPSDAADILKSALARGEIRMIGATTYASYKDLVSEDQALARRFRLVKLDEPTIEDTRTILHGLKPRLEKNYGVEISSQAMDVALGLAPRYLRAHRLPDKVIGWLDTAAVKVEIKSAQQHGAGAVVTGDDIIRVISQEAKIPVDVILRETGDRLRNMEEALARRVIGQKHAIEALSRRIRLNKGPLKESFLRPDGVFLFLGPTGVGKTELAKALAEFLFGDERKMIRLDMSEYQDDMVAVEKLIGMPRGIVGSERGGILTSALQENPYTVLLLDEVEKASPYLLNLFLQAFDEGWLTDGRGRKAYLSDAVVIMTSNLGGDHFRRLTESVGFAPKGGNGDEELVSFKSVRREVIKEVERRFSPEFRNRIDEYLVFAPLTADEVLQITELNVKLLVGQMERLGKRLKVTPAAIGHLSRIGFSLQYGARFLKRTIEEKVKIPITLHWNEDVSWVADVENDDIVVKRGTDY